MLQVFTKRYWSCWILARLNCMVRLNFKPSLLNITDNLQNKEVFWILLWLDVLIVNYCKIMHFYHHNFSLLELNSILASAIWVWIAVNPMKSHSTLVFFHDSTHHPHCNKCLIFMPFWIVNNVSIEICLFFPLNSPCNT